jgi:putative glutamine amidotransferase
VRVNPLIGIPLCHDANGRIRAGREYLYSDIAYARAIERAGGTPIHLPIQQETTALLERIDGLLLPGGDDFLPDEPPRVPDLFTPASDTQIAFDAALLEAALARDLPVLGICYGAQLIGRAFGASFYYHLPDERPDAIDHQLDEREGRHAIHIDEATRLASIVGEGMHEVNSLHHQAISQVEGSLCVSARAPDGVIEAIEHPAHRFCLGVQWHPEKASGADSDALFDAFVTASTTSQPGGNSQRAS